METSSPHFPRSNGQAERSVQIVKRLWKKTADKEKALLDYRTTPLETTQLSPAQMLMGRRLRNNLPMSRKLLEPAAKASTLVRRRLYQSKNKQKFYHDLGSTPHATQPLQAGDSVRIQPVGYNQEWKAAVVLGQTPNTNSYVVKTNNGKLLRRNRAHLRSSTPLASAISEEYDPPTVESSSTATENEPSKIEEPAGVQDAQTAGTVVTRSGRVSVKPDRLIMY